MAAIDRSAVFGLVAQADVEDVQEIQKYHHDIIHHAVLAKALDHFDPHFRHEVDLANDRDHQQPEMACWATDDLQENDHIPDRDQACDTRLACFFI